MTVTYIQKDNGENENKRKTKTVNRLMKLMQGKFSGMKN